MSISESNMISRLPDALLLKTFQYLQPDMLARVSQVCEKWKTAVANNDSTLWKPFVNQELVWPRSFSQKGTWKQDYKALLESKKAQQLYLEDVKEHHQTGRAILLLLEGVKHGYHN